MVNEQNDDECYQERSHRVCHMARLAMHGCDGVPPKVSSPLPLERPEDEIDGTAEPANGTIVKMTPDISNRLG